jgi:hypothetical protein
MAAAEKLPTVIDLASEAVNRAARVADGFWIVATSHRPGLSKKFAEINNRCLIFRLNDRGTPVLLVVNAVDPAAIPEVKRIENETGLRVKYVVSPGGGHHLLMAAWHDAFTEARVLLCPVRVPRTANGQKLMACDRVATLDLEDPLPQFRGQLDAVVFHGYNGPRDRPAPGEGGPEPSMFGLMYKMLFQCDDPVDELWLHHRASGTVIGGENLGWMCSREYLADKPFMIRKMMKPDQVYVFTMPRKVRDANTVAECWRRVIAWNPTTLMTYHDPAGHAFFGDGGSALEQAARAAKQL